MAPDTATRLRVKRRYPDGATEFEGVNQNSSVLLSVNVDGSKLLHEVVGWCTFCWTAALAGADVCAFPNSPHGGRIIAQVRNGRVSRAAAVVEGRAPVRVAEPAQELRSEPAEEPVTEPDHVPSEHPITRIPNDWDPGWTTRESWRRS